MSHIDKDPRQIDPNLLQPLTRRINNLRTEGQLAAERMRGLLEEMRGLGLLPQAATTDTPQAAIIPLEGELRKFQRNELTRGYGLKAVGGREPEEHIIPLKELREKNSYGKKQVDPLAELRAQVEAEKAEKKRILAELEAKAREQEETERRAKEALMTGLPGAKAAGEPKGAAIVKADDPLERFRRRLGEYEAQGAAMDQEDLVQKENSLNEIIMIPFLENKKPFKEIPEPHINILFEKKPR